MASHNPDGIGEAGRATLRDMAEKHLTPELCEIFVQHLDDFRATGVADPADPTNVLSKLWRLSEHQCPLEIKKSVATAVLKNQTPVDVFFDSLDDPEIFEKWSYGNDENTDVLFKLSCKHAFQSLMALTIAHGREEMTETFKDPVLDRLFLFTDRADRDDQADDHKRFSRFVLEELISIGSSIRRIICAGCSTEVTVYETPGTMGTKAFMRATKADMEKLGIECHNEACPFYTEGTEKEKLPGTGNPQRCPAYNEKTRRLLGYLSWLSHGRRDSEHCPVTKFWDTRDPRLPPGLIQEVRLKSGGLTPLPPRVGNPLDHDLSRLPPGVVHHYRLETCPETKSLFRRARLFSIALKQFILASVGTSVPILAVKVEDGINKTTEGRPRYPLEECMYSGMHPDLDLSLPEVQAAVHAFCCYEMGRSAKALFEYFFLESAAEIKFLHFVPKNVHTPVTKTRQGWPTSNMIPIHTVAILTTKSGLQYVLDPTASQYGWRETLAPLDTYTRCRVDHKIKTEDFVPLDPARLPTEKTPRPEGDSEARRKWGRRCVAECALGQVKGRVPDGDLGGVIGLPQGEFDEFCRMLDNYLTVDVGLYSKHTLF